MKNIVNSENAGLIETLVRLTASSESAVRLLLTVLAGYPIAVIYRMFIKNLSPVLQHVFFATSGLLLCIFNYGFDTCHSITAIFVTYLLVRLLHHKSKQLLIINFVFHMSYLLIGYRFNESNKYDIRWTMPHCILVLRMIGFGFDFADGQKPREQLSKDQKETALSQVPLFVELAGYAFFTPAFLVGPQFPFNRYKRFIQGEFREHSGSIRAGLMRGAVGMVYLAVRQVGVALLPDSYLLTDAFQSKSMLMKMLLIGLWGKIALYKYISIWLMAEGALMCIGLTYAGKTDNGNNDWSGCSSVKLVLLETGTKMAHYVQSFNVNTNYWVAQYIYKRLKFLNNRTISFVATLIFLAVWHGFHSGYYLTFFMEYYTTVVEKELEMLYNTKILPKYGHILNSSKKYSILSFVLLKSYNFVYMGWSLIPFILLSYDRWWPAFESLNFFGFIVLGIWVVIVIYKCANTRSTSQIRESMADAKKGFVATLNNLSSNKRERTQKSEKAL